MPVFNGMPYIKLAVKSILEQTYKNTELIIIDDASTDLTWKYLKSLKDKRIVLLKNQTTLGIATSLNKGLKKSKGLYIARMDAYHISNPSRLEKQLKYLQKNPKVDLCGTWVDLIDQAGKKVGEKKFPTSPSQVKKSISWYAAVIHPTYMGKKSFFQGLNGYRQKYELAEDYDLLSRAKNKYIIANIPLKLLLWRLNPKRSSRTNMRKMDKIDLMIKRDALKRDGYSLTGLLAFSKKALMTYVIPFSLKFKLATKLKQA